MPLPSEISPQIQYQNNLAAASRQLSSVNNIGQSNDGFDLYYFIDFLVYLVDQAYPFIPCPSGCSSCCSHYGLPRTSALEWQQIYPYLQQLPQETLLRVIERNESLHRVQLEAFLNEQRRIENPETREPVKGFDCKECPFLLEGRCSIYPVRPAICRGFGYFTWRPGPEQDSQIFACQMAADVLLDELRQRNQPHAALPAWNLVGDKIYALNQQLSTGVMATLPLWLMAHTQLQAGQIQAQAPLKELSLAPDFKLLASAAEPS